MWIALSHRWDRVLLSSGRSAPPQLLRHAKHDILVGDLVGILEQQVLINGEPASWLPFRSAQCQRIRSAPQPVASKPPVWPIFAFLQDPLHSRTILQSLPISCFSPITPTSISCRLQPKWFLRSRLQKPPRAAHRCIGTPSRTAATNFSFLCGKLSIHFTASSAETAGNFLSDCFFCRICCSNQLHKSQDLSHPGQPCGCPPDASHSESPFAPHHRIAPDCMQRLQFSGGHGNGVNRQSARIKTYCYRVNILLVHIRFEMRL